MPGGDQGLRQSSAESRRLLEVLAGAGEIVRDFEVVSLLGEGGMGAVFLGVQRSLDRKVAIKCVRSDAFGGPEGLARFTREAAVLGRLEHPGIVRLFTVEERAGLVFIVSEFVDGESLKQRLRGPGFTVRDGLLLIRDIARVLAYVHGTGIVHRDIKSENVLLPRDGGVKVIDFGLAKGFADDAASSNVTRAGQFLGTPGYLAPEIIRSQVSTPLSDVYSLGILLFETLTGRLPFTGPAVAVLTAHLKEPPPRLAEALPGIPPALDGYAAVMLAKEPHDRPADMATVARDLDDLAAALSSGRGEPDATLRVSGGNLRGEPSPRRGGRRPPVPEPRAPRPGPAAGPAKPPQRLRLFVFVVSLLVSLALAFVLLSPRPAPEVAWSAGTGEGSPLVAFHRIEAPPPGAGTPALVLTVPAGRALRLRCEPVDDTLSLERGGDSWRLSTSYFRPPLGSVRFEAETALGRWEDGGFPVPALAVELRRVFRSVDLRAAIVDGWAASKGGTSRDLAPVREALLRSESMRMALAGLPFVAGILASRELSLAQRRDLYDAARPMLDLDVLGLRVAGELLVGVDAALAPLSEERAVGALRGAELRAFPSTDNNLMPREASLLGFADEIDARRRRRVAFGLPDGEQPARPEFTVPFLVGAAQLRKASTAVIFMRHHSTVPQFYFELELNGTFTFTVNPTETPVIGTDVFTRLEPQSFVHQRTLPAAFLREGENVLRIRVRGPMLAVDRSEWFASPRMPGVDVLSLELLP